MCGAEEPCSVNIVRWTFRVARINIFSRKNLVWCFSTGLFLEPNRFVVKRSAHRVCAGSELRTVKQAEGVGATNVRK